MTKCSCGYRDKDKCNKENGSNNGKMCLKEGNNYVPQELVQYITRSAWVDDVADYLIEIGVYTNFKHACEVVKSAVYSEGDEFFKTNPAEFVRNMIRRELEE